MKTTAIPPHYVLTGGPCAGKTTTIELLKARGYHVSPEPGRIYIENELKAGKTFDELLSDIPTFELNLLRKYVEIERMNRKEGIMFFDRSIIDCLGYYRVYGVAEDEELRAALKEAHYRKIFFLDMIEDFKNDNVRIETPQQAKKIHEAIYEAYIETGYSPVNVPVMPPEERVEYILDRL